MYYGLETTVTFVIFLVSIVITLIAQFYVNNRYAKYSKIKCKSRLSGFEVARKILDNNGLNDIHIVETKGMLSDHYDPKRKVIRLSKEVFSGTSIVSVSVAAHECGHAVQDKDGYGYLKFRNMIVPLVNIFSKIGYFVILIGFIFSVLELAYVGIFLIGAILIFQLVTLPVEFNASKRANVFLTELSVLDSDEISQSDEMLKAAALTYVASLINTLLQIFRLFIMARNND